MHSTAMAKVISGLAILFAGGLLGGCNGLTPAATGSPFGAKSVVFVSDEERDCLGRAMYFEAKRNDVDGLLAVGTVVMNRAESAGSPGGRICDVVGRPGQFAAGVLTKPMQQKDLQKVADVTDAVLAGERHPGVGTAQYFHTAGRRFPYGNMHYVAVVGGNAFYEKREGASVTRTAAVVLPPRVDGTIE